MADLPVDDRIPYPLRTGISRREFGALGLGTGLICTVTAAAARTPTRGSDVSIHTPDGTADAWFVHPVSARAPGVLLWPDIFGLRPAFRQMAMRLAESGYAVLVVNPFYRTRPAPTAPEHADFNDPATRTALMALHDSLTPATAATDARAFTGWLEGQREVDPQRHMATAGYCMGGPLVLRTAAAVPDRIAAAASFHGGGLVTDKPDSPHRLIPRMKGEFLIAIAASDDAKEPAARDTLRQAFAAAKLPAEIEVYPGTQHGWCPPDSRVYDREAAERAWTRLLALLQRALPPPTA